jgi:glycosyltransferase involved in cell wall biosynthesis
MMKISVLMAVYDPDPLWWSAQLASLDAQTAELSLEIRDDASPGWTGEALRAFIADHYHRPFSFARNGENLGSVSTFALLTRETKGEVLLYCDQDDIWEPEKAAATAALLVQGVSLGYCGLRCIDGEGMPAPSLRLPVREGYGLLKKLLYHNWIPGCALAVRREDALASLPWKEGVHDQLLAIHCARLGRFAREPRPLLRYRLHGGNQTGRLRRVSDRESYIARRVEPFARQMSALAGKYPDPEVRAAHAWGNARIAWFQGEKGSFFKLLGGLFSEPRYTLLDIAVKLLPEKKAAALLCRLGRK